MSDTLRRSRRLAATATLTSCLLLTGLAGTALASDYDGDGASTPADCNDYDPAVHPGAIDEPDLTFEDTNCDGIDGDIAKAVFVDAGTGQDTATAGTKEFPFKTIGAAINKAKVAPVKDVYVTARAYSESLALSADVGIYGGYTPTVWRRTTLPATIVTGNPAAAVADNVTGVVLQLLTLQGADQPTGGSSYGLRVVNNAKLALDHVTALGGTAGSGGSGGPGATGSIGTNGTRGGNGSCGGGAGTGPAGGTGANDGGKGGNGGGAGSAGTRGSNGAPAGSPGTGGPAGGGDSGSGHEQGGGGSPGNAGSTGATGNNGNLPPLTLDSGTATWSGAPGNIGLAGGAGTGGGGGGGGGGAQVNGIAYSAGGGAGGSGGAGGGGGGGGQPGAAGGGSFGIYVFKGSVVSRDSILHGGPGGSGGNGGDRGPGGSPGTGGDPGAGASGGVGSGCGDGVSLSASSGSGAKGGAGGAGGSGGAGSGGTGGPSAGVYRGDAASAYSQRNTTQAGTTGGIGGRAGGNGPLSATGPVNGLLQSTSAATSTVVGDFDSDGVTDPNDDCPTVAAVARANGCPVRPPQLNRTDTDGDAVPDFADRCPAIAAPNDPDGDGCPNADTDGDKVPDYKDQCPTIAAPNDPDGDGCPNPVVNPSSGPGTLVNSVIPSGGGATAQSEQIIVTLTYFARAGATNSKFKSLKVRNVPLGATVKVTCKGKGCPKGLKGKGYTKTNAFGAVDLKRFIKKPLRVGTRITVVVSKPNAISAVKILTLRKSKAPSIATRCIRPGTTNAVACV